MSEQEQEHSSDELEIEILDLDALPSANNGTEQVSAAVEPISMRVSLHKQLAPHQRRTRLIVSASLLAFTLFIIVGSSPVVRTTALPFLFHPPSTPTLAPTATTNPNINQFFVEGVPVWGKLYLDGHPVQEFYSNIPLAITRGQHHFLVQAAPFLPLSCIISVPIDPANPTDTCHYTKADMQVSGTWTLQFYESLATLPTGPQQALIQATQAVLDKQQSTTIVQPGEQYVSLSTPGMINIAKEPLRATMRFHLLYPAHIDSSCLSIEPTTNAACIHQLNECLLFCPLSEGPQGTPFWQVQAALKMTFDYTTMNNTVVATNQPAAKPNTTDAIDHMLLAISWDSSHWHVSISGPSLPSGNPVTCISAENNVTQNLFQQVESTYSGTSIQFVAGASSVDGCLLALLLLPNTNATADATSPNAYFLYRFGLYLAVNKMAHLLWPQIPQADAYERGLAQKLAAPLFSSP